MSTSDYNAIVPIKKRRFPLIQSPSPKEISTLPPLDDNMVKVEEPCVSDGPTVSNSSTITTSEISEKKKILSYEVGKRKSDLCNVNMVQTNNGSPTVEFQENKDTCRVNENHGFALHKKPDLKLPPSDPNSNPELCAEKKSEVIDRKELDRCNSSTSVVKKEVELSVGLKEHLVPESVVEGNNLELVLLNLSLSKQGSHTQCLTGNDGSLQQSNRGNWDLNTSMEFWEGCASDDPPVNVSVIQTNTIVTTHRCSTEMVKTDTLSGKLNSLDHSDNLHLSLCSSDHRHVMCQEQSSFVKLDFRKSSPSLSSPGRSKRFDDLNGTLKVVKPEPFVEGSKLESKSDEVNVGGLSDIVKREFLQLPNASDVHRSMNVVEAKSVKSESIYQRKQEALKTLGGRLDLVEKQVLPEVDNSCPVPMPFVAETSKAAGNLSCSTDLVTNKDMSNHSELQTPTKGHLSTIVHQGGHGCGGDLVKSEIADISKDTDSKDSSSSPIIKPMAMPMPVVAENNPQWRPLDHMNEQCSSLHGGEECSVSDEEKISISADLLEEDPYSSEYESDGKQDVDVAMDAVDHDIEEDYEDGEVREPILMTQVESSICETIEVKKIDHGDCSNGLTGSDCSSLVSVKQEDKSEVLDVKREDIIHSVTSNQSSEQEHLKELLVEDNMTKVCLNKTNNAIKVTGPGQLYHCEKISALEDQKISSEKATSGNEESIVTVSKSDIENVKTVDFVQNDDLAVPNVKEPLNNDDVTDDFTCGNRHTQIVNPCQASTSSPIKTRPSLVRSVLTQTDRELIPDMAHEGEIFQPQGRDDPYRDVFPKFYMHRHENQSHRTNFTRRRGRFTIRINSVQGEWDFNPTSSPGVYNDQIPPYDARRRKYTPVVSDDDIDQNHYKMKPGGPFRSAGHRGRQILDDEGPIFCHMPSRRKSPGRRDGPPIRGGVKMVHRMHRNISPSRCIREPESEMVGPPRHSEKFMRALEDESMDPMYAHPQPPFEVDRPPFIPDRRNFPIQRKSFQRVDSKSPGRSRGRSPGQWFPSKRKSERFFGHPEMARRSPPGYRMRSPDQPPPIHGDMPVRRHGFPFPSLPPDDLRDMGSARDQGHMRSGIRSRNQTDRISYRNRRFEEMDHRDRIESNEYFDGPVHPGQLNELVGDGNDDNRRRFPDRHEHLHPFRPQCNDSDGENYHNNANERPRPPFRYCAEDEAEFHERGKMREREFDRRLKNQPGNLGRRTGGVIEEHEVEEYRHGRQLWNEHHGFEDMSRMKRKRF